MSGSDSHGPDVVVVTPAIDRTGTGRTEMTAATGNDDLAAEIAACFACLHDPASDPAERARWQAWLAGDPARATGYLTLSMFWDAVPEAVPFTTARPAPAAAVIAPPSWQRPAPSRRPAWQIGALAASLLLIAATGVWQRIGPAPVETVAYATERGQQTKLSLADGSTVLLDADSQLLVQFERGQRTVQLLQGQALFDVAHDPSRPFVVRARDGEVRAVGTEFDVLVSDTGVDVTLIQGAVIVAPPARAGARDTQRRVARLAPGQQVSYHEDLGAIRNIDPAIATAWRDGRPTYLDQPLGKVAADLSRYLRRQIVLSDPELAELRYTGTVSVKDLPSWARALEQAYPVRAALTADGGLVLSRKGI